MQSPLGKSLLSRTGIALCASLSALIAACTSTENARVGPASETVESFNSSTFSRSYPLPPTDTCPAAQRALLGQGYNITNAGPASITGKKHFLQTRGEQFEIEFTITCLADGASHSSIYVNAVQHLYTIRQTNTSASVGVSMVGSLSMPIGKIDDSLVKIGSVTMTTPSLYQQFFKQLESNLPAAASQ